MRLKSDADIDAASKSSNLKKERRDIIVAQLRSTRPEKLEELWGVWNDKDGGLSAGELSFAKSLVDLDAETPAPATPAPPPPVIPGVTGATAPSVAI